ncbi:MAG: ImmA/IrrE family metallo-endopeptidase [Solirubrobacterales bacterium]
MQDEGFDREAIERRAEEVLAEVPSYVWDGESIPVPVEDIVDTVFGLRVCDVEDMTAAPGCPALEEGQSLSGLLLSSRGEIWVNAEEARQWPPRRRFTIGHELGHWVMHRTGQQALFCRRATVDPQAEGPGLRRSPEVGEGQGREGPGLRRSPEAGAEGKPDAGRGAGASRVPPARRASRPAADTRPPLPITEEEANMFAAALLMPGRLIRRHYRDCAGEFTEMCRRFDSSGAAMGRRLHQAIT